MTLAGLSLPESVRSAVALVLTLSLSCGSTTSSPAATSSRSRASADAVRYRLKLRENSVDPGDAFRCYGHCQPERTPNSYLECLSQCPGFEITPGAYCAKDEVPPLAACLTVRRIPASKEPDPGLVVLAVVGSFLIVISAAALCAQSSSCGYGYGATFPAYRPY